MFYPFPENTTAVAIVAYDRPYDDPIAVEEGEVVMPDLGRRTDMLGWVWCVDPRGKAGWTPEAWIDRAAQPWRMRRAFQAIELTVLSGDIVTLHFAESGFLWATGATGASGWVPDSVVRLATESPTKAAR